MKKLGQFGGALPPYPPPQSEIPDDLKADSELPLDALSALAAIRHLAALLVESLDRLIEALEA